MPTYNEARELAACVQDMITEDGPNACQDSQEAYSLLVDCGFMLGLIVAGEPSDSGTFRRTYQRLNDWYTYVTEEAIA